MTRSRKTKGKEIASSAGQWIVAQDDWLKSYLKILLLSALLIVLITCLFAGWLLIDNPKGDAGTAAGFLVFAAFGALVNHGWLATLVLGTIIFGIKTLVKYVRRETA